MFEETELVGKLVDSSRRNSRNPYEFLIFPEELERDAWFTTPEVMTLYGTSLWDTLDEAKRKELSFFEAVNFFSLNIHGEKALMQGLASRLYDPEFAWATEYLHHFLDEENKHSTLFGTFCQRYAKRVYTDRKLTISTALNKREADFLFFAKVMIFEELSGINNLTMARDERVHWLSRKINDNHHFEESRHLAFGRKVVVNLHRMLPAEKKKLFSEYLAQYLVSTWREFYQPDIYRDAGLAADPWEVMTMAWEHPAQRAHRRAFSAKCLEFLLKNEILTEEPTL